MVSIRNFSQHLFRIVNSSMWSMPLCVQSNVSWGIFYIYIGCFVFWVGLLFPLLCLSDFLLNPGIWQCCRASFSVNPVKHTGGFTIKPNLGLWLMQVYVNSCVCFCVLCMYSEGLFREKRRVGRISGLNLERWVYSSMTSLGLYFLLVNKLFVWRVLEASQS